MAKTKTYEIDLDKIINETYIPFTLNYKNRYEVYYGGGGSGKSVFITQKLIIKLLNTCNPRRLLVIRKVGASIKESVWQLFKDILSDWNIKYYTANYVIRLENKSEIIFKGLDDQEKIKSIANISDIWCEEGTELLEQDYDQLDLRMRSNEPFNQLIISYNPISPLNWVYNRFHKIKQEETFVLRTTWRDNTFLPEDYIKKMNRLKETNPRLYKIYSEGEFCGSENIAFGEFNAEIHVCEPFIIPNNWIKWRSLDNGYTDPFAFYWFALSETGIVYTYREYTRDYSDEKILYSDQAKNAVVRTQGENIITTVVGHDAYSVNNQGGGEGKSLIDYYKIGGIHNFTRANTDRILRKTTVHEYLKPIFDEEKQKWTSKVQIFDTCTKLIETLPNQLTDPKNCEKVEDSMIDHWYDGWGYGLIFSHSARSNEFAKEKPKKLIDQLRPNKFKR